MVNINLKDKKLFGNDAGEDEDLEVLNAYYVDHSDFDDFFDNDEKISVVSARKGMGKSALLSRLEYKLTNESEYNSPLVIRVKGNELLGLGDFSGEDHAFLENYWKQIICKRIIVEIGERIGFALNSDEMSMVELSELDGFKSKNLIGALITRVIGKLPFVSTEVKISIPNNLESLLQNYQNKNNDNSKIWILIDDIDAKFQKPLNKEPATDSVKEKVIGTETRVPGMSKKDADAVIEQAMKDLKKTLKQRKLEINKWDKNTQKQFKTWFGKADEKTKKIILDRINKMEKLLDGYTLENFKAASPPKKGRLAYVYPHDDSVIYLDDGFASAPATGRDSKMGTLAHEMAHFNSVGGTDDHEYGEDNAKKLAKDDPDDALDNSDNFEYYIEG